MGEVAVLTTRLAFKVDGASQAESAFNSITAAANALKAAEQALASQAGNSSAVIQEQANVVRDAMASVQSLAGELQALVNEATKLGSSVQTLGADIQATMSKVESQTAAIEANKVKMSELAVQLDELSRARDRENLATEEGRKRYADLQAQTATLSTEYNRLRDETAGLNAALDQEIAKLGVLKTVEEGVAGADRERVKRVAALERETKKLIGTERQREGRPNALFGLSITELVGWFNLLRAGNLSGTLMVHTLLRMSHAGAAAGGALAAMKGPLLLIAGLAVGAAFAVGKVAKDLAGLAAQINLINPRIKELITGIGGIAGARDIALAEPIERGLNRLRAQGNVSDPEAATAAVVKAAEQLQFLNSVAGDAQQAMTALFRVIETGDFSGLADFGIDLQRLQTIAQSLAQKGFQPAIIQGQLFIDVQRQLAERSGEVAAQAGRERDSWAAIGEEIADMKDRIAQAFFSEPVQEFITAVKGLIPTLTAGLGVLAGWGVAGLRIFTNLTRGVVNLTDRAFGFFEGVAKAIADIARLASKAPGEGHGFWEQLAENADASAGAWVHNREQLRRYIDEIERANSVGLQGPLDPGNFEAIITPIEALQRAMQIRQGGFGLVDQVLALGEATLALREKSSPENILAVARSYDDLFTTIATQGPAAAVAQIQAVQIFVDELARAGEISQAQADKFKRNFAPVVEAVTNTAARVDGLTGAQTTAADVSRILTGSIGTLGGQVSDTTGRVDGLVTALNSIPTQIATNIHIGVTGPGAALLGGGSINLGSANVNVTAPRPFGQARVVRQPATTTTSRTTTRVTADMLRSINRAEESRFSLINRFPGQTNTPVTDSAARGAINFGRAPKGGGGGGGGSALATLEQIRELMRQVNTAIKIGINNGVRFGTAGNVIPTGAPGEFLNTRGGDVFQTVNIRGVWDFASPDARRQLLRELKELLADLERENA